MSSSKRLFFGTRERMTWVKCPAINADLSLVKWSSSGVYLNGGGYSRSSMTGHKLYQFAWNLDKSENIRAITDYASGIYGDGLIYFLDPFAVETNVLPMYWSAPRLGKDDGPPLIKGQRPTLTLTGQNTLDYPTQSAVYTVSSAVTSSELFIPVPRGYTFHLGVHGTSSGSASIAVEPTYYDVSAYVEDEPGLYTVPAHLVEGPLPQLYSISSDLIEDPPGSQLYVTTAGLSVQEVPMLSVTTTRRTNLALSGVSGVSIKLTGTGTLSLAGLIAQVRPDGEDVPEGGFISGQGHSGVRFDAAPSVTGYSSPEALDKQGGTATLRETGAWE